MVMQQQLQYVQQAKTSIVLVTDADYERFITDCAQYPHYVALIPQTLYSNIHHLNLIRDIYFTLQYYKELVSHPNLSMIYVLRATLVQEMCALPRFQMLHAICKQHPHVTLLMAICIAMLLEHELADDIHTQTDNTLKDSFAFINQFPSLDILYLYDDNKDLQLTYPKELAKAQAITANYFRVVIREKHPVFHTRLQEIATFAQQYISLRK